MNLVVLYQIKRSELCIAMSFTFVRRQLENTQRTNIN